MNEVVGSEFYGFNCKVSIITSLRKQDQIETKLVHWPQRNAGLANKSRILQITNWEEGTYVKRREGRSLGQIISKKPDFLKKKDRGSWNKAKEPIDPNSGAILPTKASEIDNHCYFLFYSNFKSQFESHLLQEVVQCYHLQDVFPLNLWTQSWFLPQWLKGLSSQTSRGEELGFTNPTGPGPDIPPTADAQKVPVE